MATKLPKEVNALIDAVTSEDFESVKSSRQLELGKLYLWYYPNPKYANVLDVYDQLPLVILLDIPSAKHILGINIHYLPYTYRLQFMKHLIQKGTKIKYSDIQKAWKAAKIPTGFANLAIRKYLINRIASNIKIFENDEDKYNIVKNILPHFKKKTMEQVYKDINKKMKRQRDSIKSTKKVK